MSARPTYAQIDPAIIRLLMIRKAKTAYIDAYTGFNSTDQMMAAVVDAVAARDLYKALEDVREDVCSLLCESTWPSSREQHHSARCIAVRAALAKARGEG